MLISIEKCKYNPWHEALTFHKHLVARGHIVDMDDIQGQLLYLHVATPLQISHSCTMML